MCVSCKQTYLFCKKKKKKKLKHLRLGHTMRKVHGQTTVADANATLQTNAILRLGPVLICVSTCACSVSQLHEFLGCNVRDLVIPSCDLGRFGVCDRARGSSSCLLCVVLLRFRHFSLSLAIKLTSFLAWMLLFSFCLG